ncbi:MAG: WS/DGAT domain-containing protein [Candidatus Nanopelagicales bacterium]
MAKVSMSVQDALWLTMDRPNNLMVVDGAMVLSRPVTLEQVRAVYTDALGKFPVFARRAVPSGLGWAWEDDPHFAIDRHLSQVTLPQPAGMAELQRFLADQRTAPLPKDRPLWQAFLIDEVNLDDGTTGSAVVNRFHHAIADGVRLTQVMLGLCDVPESGKPVTVAKPSADPDLKDVVSGLTDTARTAAEATGKVVGRTVKGTAADVLHAVTHPVDALTGLPRQAADLPGSVLHGVEDGVQLVRHPDHLLDALDAMGVESTRGTHDITSVTKIALAANEDTIWTGKPGTKKAISWSKPIPLPEIKDIGRAGSATVNDVLLAAIAGGLRQYLLERDAFVDEVNWMVPVNLKPFADNLPPDLGNYFALVFLPMPLDTADPRERLVQMHQRMDRIKHSDEAVLTFGLQRVVSQSPGQIAFALTNFFANKAVGVLTNVPGPRAQMTFAGVPVLQVVGFAPCSGDQPMTATIFSYNDEVTVGFATDAGLIPDPDVLAEHVVAQLQELAEAVGTA